MSDKELSDELKEIFEMPNVKELANPAAPAIMPKAKPPIHQVIQPTVQVLPIVQKEPEELAKEDFDYIRTNLKNLIDSGQVALGSLTEIAEGSQHPRAFEALSALMKSLSESTRELIDLHKKMKDLKKDGPEKQVTNNNLIVTTEEMIKMIKKATE